MRVGRKAPQPPGPGAGLTRHGLSFTRGALWALVAASGFTMFGDFTAVLAWRAEPAVALAGFATLVGLGLAFLGTRGDPDARRLRFTRIAAAAWAVSIPLVTLAGYAAGAAPVVRAVGGAAFVAAPVLAVATLGHRLARYILVGGASAVALAYLVAGAVTSFGGVPPSALTLPGNAALFLGYWMTLRTYREPGANA